MKKSEFLKILRKYNQESASDEEKAFLSAYYNLFEAEPDVVELLEAAERETLKTQIKATIDRRIELNQNKRPAKIYTMARRMVAAAILLIAVGAAFAVYLYGGQLLHDDNYVGRNIPPGGNKAILTLANGSKIVLTNAKNGILVLQGGVRVIKTPNGQVIYDASDAGNITDTVYNTITTPRGGQYMVMLPDSSKVYLDAASSLRFPTVFTGKTRTVFLTGEGYFEVAHNKNKPFHVVAGGQTVEVLGTHFNINAYDDEQYISTTLLEGSVKVSLGKSIAILAPGDQAHTLSGNGLSGIEVYKGINTDAAVAWKNGYFNFENADIQTIMKQYARWYDVKIVFDGKVDERLFSGEIHRNLNAPEALELLDYADVHFKIDGKTIVVSR